jgi:lipoate-protein ligase A
MLFSDAGFVSPEKSSELEREMFSCGNDALMIYSRDRPTVSLGRFSDKSECVNMKYAGYAGIDIVRRMSGGSPIYCDRDQITFSLTVGRKSFPSINGLYETSCNCLISTLSLLGIDAEYKPANDVLVNGMKISGSAQYRDRDRCLVHGSLILKLDERTMDAVLVPLKDRRYGRLTSVEESLGRVPGRQEIADAFRNGFLPILG